MFYKSKSKHINFLKINREGWRHFYWPRQRRKKRILLALNVFIVFLSAGIISFVIAGAVFLFNVQIIYKNIELSGQEFANALYNPNHIDALYVDIDHIQKGEDLLKAARTQLNLLKKSRVYFFRYLFDNIDNLESLLSQLEFIEKCFNKYIALESNKLTLVKYEEREKALKQFYSNIVELNIIQKQIDGFINNLEKPNLLSFWHINYGFNKNILIDLKDKIQHKVYQSQFLATILGYPKSLTYLLVFTDSQHLKGVGGTIKIIGTLEISRGKISRLSFIRASELDKYASQEVRTIPPLALKKYAHINNWQLSNANWSPDWPSAAKRIEWLYYKEKMFLPKEKAEKLSNKIDGVILITDNFLARILRSTNNNFISLNENWTETNSLLDSAHASTSLAIIINTIDKQFSNLSNEYKMNLWNALKQGILNKEVACYFKNIDLENMSKKYNIDGELKQVNTDYLLVVDYNLSGNDYLVPRQIDYKVKEKENGWYAYLTINYSNQSIFSQEKEDYTAYTRIYLPQGIKIATSSGFKQIDISSEFNKTVVGSLVDIPAGEIHNLYLEYKLPFKNVDYALYAQKQIGNNYQGLSIDLKALNKIKLYNPTGFNAKRMGDNHIQWEDNFIGDKVFEIIK